MMEVKIIEIEYQSLLYYKMIELRNEILRRPLGLFITPNDIESEKNDTFIGSTSNNNVIACCILTPIDNNVVKLRQMAVGNYYMKTGLGRKLLKQAEKIAKGKGYKHIVLNARETACGFYSKCGYETLGSQFIEVGIPHYKMEKHL